MKTGRVKKFLAVCVALLFISACEDSRLSRGEVTENDNSNENQQLKKVEEIAKQLEEKPLKEFISQSEEYNIRGKVIKSSLNGEDIINFEVILDEPKSQLLNLSLTFVLKKDLMQYLHANHFFASNLPSTSNIVPNGEEKGIGVSKSFLILPEDHVLKPETFDNEIFKNLISQMKIKTSWLDENGKEKIEYIVLNNENISIDEEVYSLFN